MSGHAAAWLPAPIRLLLLALPTAAWAHGAGGAGGNVTPAWVVLAMALSAGAYGLGAWRLRGRSRHGLARRAGAFAAGWLVLAVALSPPLEALADEHFSAHMLQHELLMVVAAPLLVAAQPLPVWAWALSMPARRSAGALLHCPAWRAAWHVLSRPAMAWVLHAAALWLWHVPALFDTASRHPGWHALQHASFVASALLYWWTLFGARTRAAQGVALASLFTTMLHTGALGALLALSARPWYGGSLEDQQVGGLLRWVPGGLVYLGAGLAIAQRWAGFSAASARPACRPAA